MEIKNVRQIDKFNLSYFFSFPQLTLIAEGNPGWVSFPV
jgi:hypothetical protein